MLISILMFGLVIQKRNINSASTVYFDTSSKPVYLDLNWNELSCGEKVRYSELLLNWCLYPYINEAISNIYGENRRYMNFEILHLQGLTFGTRVTVRVETFVGAHNPPYGIETIKLDISAGQITLYDYQHEEKR